MTEFEEILEGLENNTFEDEDGFEVIIKSIIVEAMKKAYILGYTEGRNKATDWISENAEAEYDRFETHTYAWVKGDSILAAKTCKELDI